MKRISVYLYIIIHIFSSNVSAAEIDSSLNQDKITKDQYVTGGIIGSFLGFGLGHVVQSRNDTEKQDFFMLSELGVFGGTMIMIFSTNTQGCTGGGKQESDCLDERHRSTGTVIALGSLAFLGLRVWEIYDLWSYPHVQQAQPKTPQAAFLIHPQSFDQVATSFVLNF